MSYILDALKKAERERGVRQVPTLMTVHDLQGVQRNRTAAVAGGLLVCAAVAAWFFMPALNKIIRPAMPSLVGADQNRTANQSESKRIGESVPATATPSPLAPTEPAPAKSGRAHDTAAVDSSEVKPGLRSTAAPPSETAQKPSDGGRRASQSTQGATLPKRGTEPVTSPPVDNTPQPVANAVSPATNEVTPALPTQTRPASLKEAMAKMILNILVYEDAEADRKVYINGRKYVKGDLVDGLYLVESITLEGAVLSYEGQRALLRPH